MREARLQVASFELSDYDSSMDQKKAIKQYSRSAADAETPLPHELRPEGSLKTTMTYLLHNIMNLCDDPNTSIGDWFHFVWDRTRGIRKDITQQELCSPLTVELVEQCVRFHIHCSARLAAEDPSIFDQKINTENLTKCLQTLKYMYNDLKLRTIKCPNEAEFRAYVVLLNLNESGNFLWEIKQLEKNILNSTEVRFALDVYFAIANNNYARFFNLTRKASYMSACLLLRYFPQVRMKAISIILKSYPPRKGGFHFNISYLAEVLAFESYDSTLNFLTHHGLPCDFNADSVYLDQTMFGTADTPFVVERAHQMVESKMNTSVAETVCGGPLPSPDCFLNIVPHSSFTADGFLKRESFYAEDQNGPTPMSKENVFKVPKGSPPVSPGRSMFQQRKSEPEAVQENPFYKPPTSAPFAAAKTPPQPVKNIFESGAKPANPFASKLTFGSSPSQAQSIFGSTVASTFTAQPSNPLLTFTKSAKPAVNPAPSIFGGSTFGSPSKAMFSFAQPVEQTFGISSQQAQQAQQALELERQRKEAEAAEKLKAAEAARKAKELAEEAERLHQLEVTEKLRLEAERAEQEAERKRREEIAARELAMKEACVTILDSLVTDVVKEKVTAEAHQAVALFVTLPEDFYDALEFDTAVDELYKIYRQEFLAYINRTKRKYELLHDCFSHWRQTTASEIRRRNKLSTIGCSILNKSLEQQAMDLHHPEQNATLSNMKQYLSGSPQSIPLPDMNRYSTINLFDVLKLKAVDSPRLFWKLLASVPHKGEEKCLGFASFISQWLCKSFDAPTDDGEVFYLSEQVAKQARTKLSICIRKVKGADLLHEKGQKSAGAVKDANGIIFFTTSTHLPASRKRLQNILDQLELPSPVSVIVYKNQRRVDDEDELGRFFDLSTEVNVASFEINIYYECHEKEKNLTEVTADACQFLLDAYLDQLTDKLFQLQMQHTLDFFQLTVGDEMWRRVELSCRQSEQFKLHMSTFNSTIQLYNACIDKLMAMVTNDFRKLPSLPEEFRQRLQPAMQMIPQSYEHFPDGWKSHRRQTQQIEFIHDLKLARMENDSFGSFPDFKAKLMAFVGSNMTTHKEKVFQAVVSKVIDSFYRQRLVTDEEVAMGLRKFCWLTILGEVVVGKFNEVYQSKPPACSTIIYYKKDLQRYKDVPWWYMIKFSALPEPTDEPRSKKPKVAEATSEEIEALLTKSSSSLNKLNRKIESFKDVSSKTREASKDFDKFLMTFEESFRGKMSKLEEKFQE